MKYWIVHLYNSASTSVITRIGNRTCLNTRVNYFQISIYKSSPGVMLYAKYEASSCDIDNLKTVDVVNLFSYEMELFKSSLLSGTISVYFLVSDIPYLYALLFEHFPYYFSCYLYPFVGRFSVTLCQK